MKSTLAGVAACAVAFGAVAATTRFEEFTAKFSHTPDRAEIVSSTFLGSAGTEWLTAGGFQPDGTIVVGGVSLGPELNLGMKATVLGTDGPIQAPTRTTLRSRSGRPELDKSGQPKVQSLGWNHPNATAFIVRLSSDLKTIRSVTRFGWKLAGLTGLVVDDEGNIYTCGTASPGVATVSPDSQQLSGVATNRAGAATAVYLAKFSPDASHVVWVRTVAGGLDAPKLSLGSRGKLLLEAQDVRTFDSAGKQLSQAPLPPGTGPLAINPIDGSMARGGEHHWPTGREPYRDPTLNIFRPDGALLYELYNWDGPLVGLNALRLVSDSAIRGVAYDSEGHLLIHAWSDGGNSVMYREPADVFTTSKNMAGLGLNIWGAGVLSCAYVIRIDTRSYTISAGTLWVGYLQDRNKPNSVTINTFANAADGSVCLAGSSAWGLIQTGNAFPGDPTGNYVAVMNRDVSSLRFCSVLPGTGQTELGDNTRWGIASGKVAHRTLALFLSGAGGGDTDRAVPLKNARQEKFAGGLSDGHLLLLDLSVKK